MAYLKRLLFTLILAVGSMASVARAGDLVVTPSTNATTLVNALLGSGVTVVGTPTLISVPNQSGLFSGGGTIGLGISSGVVLTTGNATLLPGINDDETETSGFPFGSTNFSVPLLSPGDSDLNAIVAPQSTTDAAVLEFTFQLGDGSQPGQVYMNFIFGSDEYIEFVGTGFNDVFAFFLDGVNIALIPSTTDPVSISTVNPSTNGAYYRNNVPNGDGLPVAGVKIVVDGLTTVIQATANIGPGVHTMKFAIADTKDGGLDSVVFLQGGSFADKPVVAGYSVGGNISGLSGSVTLQNNGGDDLTISANGSFTFPNELADTANYAVTVKTQPASQTCTVTNGSGTIAGSDVSNVAVNCTANGYTLGGVLSGLAAGNSVVLQNNGGDNLTLGANGAFSFATLINAGAVYNVTVLTQPGAPSQTCNVKKGKGTMPAGNLNNISVVCALNTFTVGGSVSGLTGGASVVLQVNGADDQTLTADGNFNFSALADGTAYSVTVATQPVGQTCTVTNGSGTLAGANISNVAVNCTANDYTLGGVLSGLVSGKTVVLQNNGGDNLTLGANGAFSFATPVTFGDAYSVTVLTQPAAPSQSCHVKKGTGTMPASNLNNVSVVCALNTFTVGGSVSGLTGGASVVLQVNGADDRTLTSSGNFNFSALADGTAYSVTVATQPTGQTCTVTNGSGTLAGANISNVAVSCTSNSYTLGGLLSGLVSGKTVVLQNNGGDNLTLGANGAFSFATPVTFGDAYSVTVLTQPAAPSQSCHVKKGTGTMPASNLNNVSVVCALNTFTVGGSVSGLTGGASVVLRINGADDQTLTADGNFNFSALADGTAYTVTVATQPTGQTCTVTNGSGTLAGANISNVAVSCTTVTATTTYTAPSATRTGDITASFSGGGVACGYVVSRFLAAPPGSSPVPPTAPPAVVFPHGLFDFTASTCTIGSTLHFTLVYPAPLPTGTQYLKYGPTASNPAPHWYSLPATISGNTVTFSITDGGLGDDDLTANGTITDQGGPAVPTSGVSTDVPTLSEWAMVLLALLLMGTGRFVFRLRG